MIIDSGYLYVNSGGDWPTATLGPNLQQVNGAITLTQSGGKFATAGAFVAGPFQVSDQPTEWFRVAATLESGWAAGSSHLQFFTYTGNGSSAPWNPASATPFTDPGWKSAPRDTLDIFIANPPDTKLFVGALFRGDGSASPSVEQIQIFYGRDTYTRFLPPIYRSQPIAADLLDRFLTVNQSILSGIENEIEDLPLLFDSRAASWSEPPSWLGWLSGWLTFILDEQWPDAQARQNLEGAYRLYGKRGTLEGLRLYLKIYGGVNAIIEEPAAATSIWSLETSGFLGMSTMLAPAALQGAVLDTSATADASYLSTDNDLGAALFEDLAHVFYVGVYCAELTSSGALDRIRAVLEREKPAHTTYQLRVIEPAMRVGVQCRIGIDAIVADAPPPAAIGFCLDAGALGAGSTLCN